VSNSRKSLKADIQRPSLRAIQIEEDEEEELEGLNSVLLKL
jgi:hypothetical protein